MEKIIFFGLVIPILIFMLYLGVSAFKKGFSAKSSKNSEKLFINSITKFYITKILHLQD